MTGNKLRYYSLRKHLSEVFNHPVLKICVDAGFTCPNRDGTKGHGGCIYCNDLGSGAPYIQKDIPVSDQIKSGIGLYTKNNPDARFIVYFQPFSNTYAPVDHLKTLYSEALSHDKVCGLSIGTRPDCVSPEILDLIADLSSKTYLWLEYGVETVHDSTLQKINRKHTFDEFLNAYDAAKSRDIRVCLHMIAGLPYENRDDILASAREIGSLQPDGIKIHSLYIETETKLHTLFLQKPWELFSAEEYMDLAADILEVLPVKTVIHRLVGEGLPNRLVAPLWSKDKNRILQGINERLISRNSHQGHSFQ